MATQLTPLSNTALDNFISLVTLANNIVNVLATEAMTANNSANGALAVGNSQLSGIFGATIMAAGSLRGGNVAGSANLVISSNVVINAAASLSLGNSSVNSYMNSSTLVIPVAQANQAIVARFNQSNITFSNTKFQEGVLTTTGTSGQVIDSFPITSLRSARYEIQVTDNSANGFQTSDVKVLHSGGAVTHTEYAQLFSNSQLMTFSTSVNATSVILTGVPTVANTTVKFLRTTLTV